VPSSVGTSDVFDSLARILEVHGADTLGFLTA